MKKVTIIGVDLAKNAFQLHGAAADGAVVFRKKLSRLQFCKFMAGHPTCIVAMEACGSSHCWAREMARLGHQPKLIAPGYVKPFIKAAEERRSGCGGDRRGGAASNDALRRDQERGAAVPGDCVSHPRTAGQSAHRVGQRLARAPLRVRCHVAPQGIGHLPRLAEVVEDENTGLPDLVREICGDLLGQIDQLTDRLDAVALGAAACLHLRASGAPRPGWAHHKAVPKQEQ
ncbi:hypothetical protein [Mesorhizobium silamurunense]|uniref:hypothetical protein n=1 Tax=Mesorhizobium silamurunense TaxID=499528 RepID=UPI00406BB0DC